MLLKIFFVDWEVTDSGTFLLAPNSNASKKENTKGFTGAKSTLQMRFGQKTEEILIELLVTSGEIRMGGKTAEIILRFLAHHLAVLWCGTNPGVTIQGSEKYQSRERT